VCEQKIYVFNFVTFDNIDTIDTYDNSRGIVAVSADPKITVLAYPDKTKGYIRVKSYDKSITALINAHESSIACLALNTDGTLLASASDKVSFILNMLGHINKNIQSRRWIIFTRTQKRNRESRYLQYCV
jgi:WD40 repeat protein